MLGNLSDIDLRLLRIFCAIVEAGGLTAAQGRLNTSLPRLSVAVRDLEVRLGCSLCRRGKGGFQTTAQGREIYLAAQELFADLEKFRLRVSAAAQDGAEHLQVGTLDNLISLESCPLPLAIQLYRQGQPGAQVSLQIMRPDELELEVLEGRLDLALGNFRQHLSGLHYQMLFEEEQDLYCAAEHPFFARKDEPLLEEIRQADYVERGFWPDSKRPHGLDFKRSVTAYSIEAIATLIFSGTYIGYLPSHYAAAWLAQGRLRRLGGGSLAYVSRFESITRQGQEHSPALERFAHALQQARQRLANA
ncbi:transcriptional activator GpuR [Pseudomonas knackmussii B13]|uniref:Transcriptional activator GpuR n=1 Tax=Pseudomonas knackmussii (strain DSM 6978 / CCUG 54928 / LMG 23759 / B13) TaxID=1301098 RepID=A0A024HGC6_PSEKB|nr:LysR family transcriptional regulator [Pseudomonas knackmussii]CDF83956.1 transcriptional activator GpuR [Pseudomonas knackmussii B13]